MNDTDKIATWRDSLAQQHLDHALTQIRVILTNTSAKLRALQRPGFKHSAKVQWCITVLQNVSFALDHVKKDATEQQERST